MRFNAIAWLLIITLPLGVLLAQGRLSSQSSRAESAAGEDTKVSVFFGTTRAMNASELRTNALAALKAKGHTVPQTASCVINITISGPKAGCAVMFWDLEAKWKYQVEFNSQGQVSEVRAGPMRHGTVGPDDPLPKVPEGGVKVTP
jgi:hypothetical protein